MIFIAAAIGILTGCAFHALKMPLWLMPGLVVVLTIIESNMDLLDIFGMMVLEKVALAGYIALASMMVTWMGLALYARRRAKQ